MPNIEAGSQHRHEIRDALIATGEHLQRLTDLAHALATRAGEQATAVGVPTSV